MRLLKPGTEYTLLTAPKAVRDSFYELDAQFQVSPASAIAALADPDRLAVAFWTLLARNGGTDDDFDWMVAVDLTDEDARDDFISARDEVGR